jgi:hypothetical protein
VKKGETARFFFLGMHSCSYSLTTISNAGTSDNPQKQQSKGSKTTGNEEAEGKRPAAS